MTSEPRYVEFQPDHPDEVVATMEAMSEAQKGWVNFERAVDVDDVAAEGSATFSPFSGQLAAREMSGGPAAGVRDGRGHRLHHCGDARQ